MKNYEVEKGVGFITEDVIEYVSESVKVKSIINKITGNVNVMSFDTGEGIEKKTLAFDSLLQIIDGNAEIIINGNSIFLAAGQSIVIPAHSPNEVKANERFKMIHTVIKSGYE